MACGIFGGGAISDKIEDFFGKISDILIVIQIQLDIIEKEVETFLYKTEDFHLTYV